MGNLYDLTKNISLPSVNYPKMFGTGDNVTFLELGLSLPVHPYSLQNPNSNGWWSSVAGNDMSAYGSVSYADGGAISKYDKSCVKVWQSTACPYGIGYPVEGNGYLYSVNNSTVMPVNTSTGAGGTASATLSVAYQIGWCNPSIYYMNSSYKVVRVSTNGSAQPQLASISTALTNVTMNNYTNACIRGKFMYVAYLVSSTNYYIQKYDITTAGSESLVWSYSVAATTNYPMTADDYGNAYYFTGSNLIKVNGTGALASVSLTGTLSYAVLTTTSDYVLVDNTSYNYFYVYDFNLVQLKATTSTGVGLSQNGLSGNRQYLTYRWGSSTYNMSFKCFQVTMG